MAQSFVKIAVHVVYSTKNRMPVLTSDIRNDLYSYTGGILDTLGCTGLIVGGTEDHVHVLCLLSRTITVAKMAEEIKKGTSRWLKTQSVALEHFSWQSGYAGFAVSESRIQSVIDYIRNQEEHHRKMSFKDEFRQLLVKHNVAFDENTLWI